MTQDDEIDAIPEFRCVADGLFRFNVYGRTIRDGASWVLNGIVLGLPAVLLAIPLVAAMFGAAIQWGVYFTMIAFGLGWVAVMFAFTTCHVDCEIDVDRRQLRQPIFVFGRHVWTRRFSLRDGDQIGLCVEPGNGNHIVFCYRGRTRWRFTSFSIGTDGERDKLLAFVQSVGGHARCVGYWLCATTSRIVVVSVPSRHVYGEPCDATEPGLQGFTNGKSTVPAR